MDEEMNVILQTCHDKSFQKEKEKVRYSNSIKIFNKYAHSFMLAYVFFMFMMQQHLVYLLNFL